MTKNCDKNCDKICDKNYDKICEEQSAQTPDLNRATDLNQAQNRLHLRIELNRLRPGSEDVASSARCMPNSGGGGPGAVEESNTA